MPGIPIGVTLADKSVSSSSSTSSLNGTRQRKTTTNFIERNKQLAASTKPHQRTSSVTTQSKPPHHRSASDVVIKCLNDHDDDETLLNRHRTHHLGGDEQEQVEEVAEISIISSHSSIEPALMMTNGEKEAEIVRASENCDRLRSELFESGRGRGESMNEDEEAVSAYLVQGKEVVQFDSVCERGMGGVGSAYEPYERLSTLTDQVNMMKFERQRPEIRSQFMKK